MSPSDEKLHLPEVSSRSLEETSSSEEDGATQRRGLRQRPGQAFLDILLHSHQHQDLI